MGHPFFGVESRMGVVNIFGEEGWNGRPSKKLGWYPILHRQQHGCFVMTSHIADNIMG